MKRTKVFWMAIVLAMFAGPLAAWFSTAAYAQGFSQLSGTVLGLDGKPAPDAEMVITNTETNKAVDVKTDAKGHYAAAGLAGGKYNIDVKLKGQVIYQSGLMLTGGTAPTYDVNLKELVGANAEAEAKRAEAEKAFTSLKSHYDAGLAAIAQMKDAQAELAKTPKDQQGPVQDKIKQAGTTAVSELSESLQLMKEDDNNRSIILARLGEANESMNNWQGAADAYQKAIAIKPDVAANYNNLGNDMAKLGKIEEARAAYQKYVDLNPTDAALAWRNFGIVLYQANRMKEAIEPLQKAIQIDPKNAQAWLLLGIALVNTMEFKTEGQKMTPVMQPGTIEAYQKAIELDPNGPVGAQAKQGLESLQAMGVGGIDMHIGKAPTPTPPKGKK
jgi:tetratricopeptide (TPR) repeat protein